MSQTTLFAVIVATELLARELGESAAHTAPGTLVATVRPQETDAPLVNPYCGGGIWAGPRFYDSRPFSVDYNTKGFGDDAPLFSWVLIDWMWADLELKEGEFDWSDLDRVVDYWQARDKQLVVRLWVTTDPGWAGAPGNKACPDWLWEAGVKYHEYKGEGGVKQRCPAYADPTWETIYLPKLKHFLSAYRDRYHPGGSPIILDHVMGFGDWGEWHTMWSHYPWPNREQKREVLGQVIRAYLDVFAPNQPAGDPVRSLAIAHVYDQDCGADLPLAEAIHRQALDLALAKGFALTRNGFIHGLSGWPNALMDKYWPDHQLIGEGNWSYEQVKNHVPSSEPVSTPGKPETWKLRSADRARGRIGHAKGATGRRGRRCPQTLSDRLPNHCHGQTMNCLFAAASRRRKYPELETAALSRAAATPLWCRSGARSLKSHRL